MKLMFIGIITLTFSSPILAVADDIGDGCVHCDKAIRGVPSIGADLEKISKRQAITKLANSLCATFTSDPKEVKVLMNNQLESFMKKYEGMANPTRGQKIRVLNKYKNELICQTREGEMNYIHQALNTGKQVSVINGFLVSELIGRGDQGLIDFNAISIMNGKKMTVLDYLNYRMENSDWSERSLQELKSLKKMLTKYLGAKTYSELSKNQKDDYDQMLLARAE